MANPLVVTTPFFRTIPPEGTAEEPDANYGPYDVFCLSTQLSREIGRRWPGAHPIFLSAELGGKMVLTVRVARDGEYLPLTPEETAAISRGVDAALAETPGYCLVFAIEHREPRYPAAWLLPLLPYLDVPAQYNPFVADGAIYAKFAASHSLVGQSSPADASFRIAYEGVMAGIMAQIERAYEAGAIICGADFARRWALRRILGPLAEAEAPISIADRALAKFRTVGFADREPRPPTDLAALPTPDDMWVGDELEEASQSAVEYAGVEDALAGGLGLYAPVWREPRVAPDRTRFLLGRLAGAQFAPVDIGENLAVRYAIVRAVSSLISGRPQIAGRRLLVPTRSAEEVRRIGAVIRRAELTAEGTALIVPLADANEIGTLNDAAARLLGETGVTYVDPIDSLRPFVWLCLIPDGAEWIRMPQILRGQIFAPIGPKEIPAQAK